LPLLKFQPSYYIEQISAALLHAENVKQLFCTIVCALMMSQWGPKHIAAGML